MSNEPKQQIPEEEIEAALKASDTLGRLLALCTTGDMSNPLKVEIGKLLQQNRGLENILHEKDEDIALQRRTNTSLAKLCEAQREEISRLKNAMRFRS